ncbi:MAG TPA: DNA repair protein RadA, partial [Baekduia sp.]|nr:DNA repair protein RadA [Baekduia sp.]
MARPSTIHVCSSCGHAEARWHGQCPGCGEWNTLVEERAPAGGGGRGVAMA